MSKYTTDTNTTLREYIGAMLSITGFSQTNSALRILRNVSPVLNMISTQVISVEEPYDVILPLNVVWLCMDRDSQYYRTLLYRESKLPDGPFFHTWKKVETIARILAPQTYDPDDLAAAGATVISESTTSATGIAQLSVPPASIDHPKFVSVSDPRNSNARAPKEHSHPATPAVSLAHARNFISVDVSAPTQIGQLLRAVSEQDSEYGTLTNGDLA